MSLNIKNAETCELATRVARITGENKTEAIHKALLARLEKLSQPRISAEEIMAIGRACAARIPKKIRESNYDDYLYDEFGLPK